MNQGLAYMAMCCAKAQWMYGGDAAPAVLEMPGTWRIWFAYEPEALTVGLACQIPGVQDSYATAKMAFHRVQFQRQEVTNELMSGVVQNLEISCFNQFSDPPPAIPYHEVVKIWPRTEADQPGQTPEPFDPVWD